MGGDYYDYFAVSNGSLGIAIGDVSGKGFPAALLMASLRASLRTQTMSGEGSLTAMIQHINTLGYESSAANRYATFFYGQFSPGSNLLCYVNAGHEPPLVFREDAVIRLDTGGTVVGLLPSVQYEQGSIHLEPGDVLVALTDGISEAMNNSDEEWGVQNLTRCIRGCGSSSCNEIIERVIASADEFVAGAKQHDDMTLIVAKIFDGRNQSRVVVLARSFLFSFTDSDLAAELQFHIETHAANLRAAGLNEQEALRRARVEFGFERQRFFIDGRRGRSLHPGYASGFD